MGAKRKRAYYTGILAEPLDWMVVNLNPNRPPISWPELGWDATDWRDCVQVLHERFSEGLFARFRAIYEHFGIDSQASGADLDLALNLAFRHERDTLIAGNRIYFAGLFAGHGVDPDRGGASLGLALELASKHVPGFKVHLEPPKPLLPLRTRFSGEEVIFLLMAVASVHEHLRGNQQRISARAVARYLLDKKSLKKVIPPRLADCVQKILLNRGNKRRDTPKPISDKRIRELIRETRECAHALRGGYASAYQWQLAFDVIPMMRRLVSAGQKELATESPKKLDDLPS